jgi:DNA invertase Pin-like site-specific DNA recombinase
MKLAGYLRVSTRGQLKDGYGLADQEKQIRAWCKTNGHTLTGLVTDGAKSGELPPAERPGLLEVLKAVRAREADGLVMRDLDRIARTLTVQEAILAQLWKLGGHAFVVTSTEEIPQDDPDDPMRTAMRQMMGVFAQLERAMLNKRLRNGRAAKHGQGGYAYGRPGYGHKALDGSLVPDDTEQAAIRRARQLRDTGASLRTIAASLEAEGHAPKHGTRWHPEAVRRILAREP